MDKIVPRHRAPTAGFEVPLEMLSACHFRIEQQCETLRRLVPHLAARGVDEEARVAAGKVIRYFDTSAVHHHADEEEDLFPALVESMAGSDAVCIREMTESLAAEHRRLETLWRGLRGALEGVVAGRSAGLDAGDIDAFAALYARHIEREEKELLPMAARLLGDEELESVGRAMRGRRGVDPVD